MIFLSTLGKQRFKFNSVRLFRALSISAATNTSRPPFLIRVGIVGASVGLATPLFAAVGCAQIWWRLLPKTSMGRVSKFVVGVILGGGGITLMNAVVLPFVRDQSDFILPFALSNATAASFWYGLGEYTFGIDVMTGIASLESFTESKLIMDIMSKLGPRIPIAGACIGGLTAITAPLLWPLAFHLCWSKDLKELILKDNASWPSDLYMCFVLPLGLPIGVVAGSTLHLFLRPFIVGMESVAWTRSSLTLLVILSGCAGVYFGMNKSLEKELYWELRINPKTGARYSRNETTGEEEPGPSKAIAASLKLDMISVSNE